MPSPPSLSRKLSVTWLWNVRRQTTPASLQIIDRRRPQALQTSSATIDNYTVDYTIVSLLLLLISFNVLTKGWPLSITYAL